DKSFFAVDRRSKNKSASGFLPSDVVAGTDGALFASDWNSHTNARGSGNALGGIFRIAKKGAQINPPKIDFSTTDALPIELLSYLCFRESLCFEATEGHSIKRVPP
ncbi:hypothetical protein N8674_03105, partial [Akkermansiaceae bacterium]|nr:hypothetical protein [Akkermansiaceae bacterium]